MPNSSAEQNFRKVRVYGLAVDKAHGFGRSFAGGQIVLRRVGFRPGLIELAVCPNGPVRKSALPAYRFMRVNACCAALSSRDT